MKTSNENETADINNNALLDALSQEFNGGNFYGLEYVLEDVFQWSVTKPVPVCPNIDWFGLYG